MGASFFTYFGFQAEAKDKLGGEFVVSPTVHDFGEVDQHAQLSTKFRLVNGLAETVEIPIVAKGYSCSEATVEPSVILPGSDTELSIVCKVGQHRGTTGETGPARMNRLDF